MKPKYSTHKEMYELLRQVLSNKTKGVILTSQLREARKLCNDYCMELRSET